MSECGIHALSFLPGEGLQHSTAVHFLSDKPAEVADLTCPVCGDMLFIYYRHMPMEGGKDVREPDGIIELRGGHSTQPQDGPQQQKEGDKK